MRTVGILSVSLILMACGGSVVDSTTNPVPVEGSFDLTFGTVTPTEAPNGPPIPNPQVTSPSAGSKARLDVRAANGGYEAVLTPLWGAPAAMAVVATSSELRLTGEANVNASGSGQGVSDRWTTIVLPRRSDGSLTGQASLTGDENVFQGDVGWMYKVAGTASFKLDQTVPDFKIASSGSAAGSYLPWDHVNVMVSEPVDLPKLLGATAAVVGTESATFHDATDQFYTAKTALWAGSTYLDGTFGAWSFGATSGALTIDAGVPDLAGNARPPAAVPQTEKLAMLDVGTPSAGFAFDGKDDTTLGAWGLAAAASGSACESGGCMALGPAETNKCSSAGPGLAGRLKPGAGGALRLRFRVRAASLYGGGPPMTFGSLLRIETVRPGGALKTTDVKTPDLTELKDGDPLDYASSWTDAAADLAPGSGELGFAVRLVDSPYGCGGPMPSPIKVQVWVDAIRVE